MFFWGKPSSFFSKWYFIHWNVCSFLIIFFKPSFFSLIFSTRSMWFWILTPPCLSELTPIIFNMELTHYRLWGLHIRNNVFQLSWLVDWLVGTTWINLKQNLDWFMKGESSHFTFYILQKLHIVRLHAFLLSNRIKTR